MKYEIGEKKDGVLTVHFTLNEKEWADAVENAYQKNKGKYKHEGFRPGRVPRKVLESIYGPYMFYEDAFNDVFPTHYTAMLKKEKDINPVDYPEVSITKLGEDGVGFDAKITLMPEVKLGKYKGIKIARDKVEVTEADVKKELKNMQEKYVRWVDVTREVKNKDMVTLNYSGSINGVVFAGGTAENQELVIGSKTFIAGFEEQLIGMKVGEEKDITVTFPENYHAMDLAGKEAVFHVKINDIREKETPKLDDTFASNHSEFETLDALKKSIEEKLTKEKNDVADRKAQNELIETIVNNATILVPETMVNQRLDAMVEDMDARMQAQGLKLEQYLQYVGSNLEDYKKSRRKEAEFGVRSSLVFEEIVKQENITATKEEVDAKLKEIAEAQNKKFTEVKKNMNAKQKELLENEILSEKVINFVKENNTITK